MESERFGDVGQFVPTTPCPVAALSAGSACSTPLKASAPMNGTFPLSAGDAAVMTMSHTTGEAEVPSARTQIESTAKPSLRSTI